MSSDVVIRNAIHNAANTLGLWILASALVMSITLPLVGLGAVYVYGSYKVQQVQDAMQQARQK